MVGVHGLIPDPDGPLSLDDMTDAEHEEVQALGRRADALGLSFHCYLMRNKTWYASLYLPRIKNTAYAWGDSVREMLDGAHRMIGKQETRTKGAAP